MEWFLIGVIFGLVVGVFMGANVSPTEIINNIDKIKGNDGVVNVDQTTKQPDKKKGFLRRIFTKKDKI